MESHNNGNEAKAARSVKIYGARVHNLKNIDVEVPLGKLVAVAGVSGSGKSSLALGILYAEGSRRYLEALSTYTRRRMTQAAEAKIESIENIPPALALRQRPAVPGVRSTFGTMTELLNSLRLMFSRLGSHRCPNGHICPPSIETAAMGKIVCPECGAEFEGPSAESFSFNSGGACRTCGGVGVVRAVNEAALVPDESLTIDGGAVAPWNSLMWSLMTDVCRAMGVRTDVPFRELTPEEREIVFHGPAVKKHILYKSKNSDVAGELDFTYYNAVYTVENALAKVKDDQGMKRVEKFLKQDVCPDCGGSRLNEKARSTLLRGIDLAQATAMTLDSLVKWAAEVPAEMPEEMRQMAESIVSQFLNTAKRLEELGLGYLTLDRAGATLSTGERQRVQLARSVRSRTTGALYVLDEPSIGLHPANVEGLLGVVRDLVSHGNSVVMVDHDTRVLRAAEWMIEMGPGAGAGGGRVVAEGTIKDIENNPASLIGGFLAEREPAAARRRAAREEMFAKGRVALRTKPLHTVRALGLEIPKGRLTVVTGVSGSGKTTLVLESLVPALKARIAGEAMPAHIEELEAAGIKRANLIDATPVGANVRSTVATYCGVLDDLGRGFFIQHGLAALSGLRRHGADNDGRAVPSRRRDNLPVVRRRALLGGRARRYAEPRRRGNFSSGAHGSDRRPGARKTLRRQGRGRKASHALRARPRLPDARRGDAGALGRRGAAAQARRRDGARTGRRGLRLRRADNRVASARRTRADRSAEPPDRTRSDCRRNRARPRHDSERRLRDRHGAWRRGRGRAHSRRRNARGGSRVAGERDGALSRRSAAPAEHKIRRRSDGDNRRQLFQPLR